MQEAFKNATVIEAYMNGNTIQFKGLSSGTWEDYKINYNAPFGPWHCNEQYEWRIKPAVKHGWCRTALFRGGVTTTINHLYGTEEEVEQQTIFVCWLTERISFTYL